MKTFFEEQEAHPELHKDHTFYEMTKQEQQEDLWRKAKFVYNLDRKRYFDDVQMG